MFLELRGVAAAGVSHSMALADRVECGDAVGGGGVEVTAQPAPACERGEAVPVAGDGLVALGGLGAALAETLFVQLHGEIRG